MPLLLSMKEDRLALIKAVDSGDPDLGTCMIFALRTSLTACLQYSTFSNISALQKYLETSSPW